MKRIFCISILMLTSILANSQDSLDSKIQRLIKVSGGVENFNLVIDNMIEIQKSNSNLEDEYWDRMKVLMKDTAFKKIFKMIIPIYAKYLNEKDIDGLLDFYNSAAGKKFVEVQPQIITESMTLGKTIGYEIATILVNEINNDKLNRFTANYENCDDAKKGTFYSIINDTKIVYERQGNKQTELNQNENSKFKINWLSECRYTLEPISSNNPNFNSEIGILEVNITSCSKTGYSYLAKAYGYDLIDEGYIYKEQ